MPVAKVQNLLQVKKEAIKTGITCLCYFYLCIYANWLMILTVLMGLKTCPGQTGYLCADYPKWYFAISQDLLMIPTLLTTHPI